MSKKYSRSILTALVAISAAFTQSSVVYAEDLNTIFSRVNELIASKNYPKAMDELGWAKKEIEKLHQTRLGELLPADVNGFKGGETTFQTALGFTNIERMYEGAGKSVKLSIAGGGGAGLGGLAGLAQMGMMFGGSQPGMDQFRIDGKTATLNTTSGTPEVSIILDSGSILTLTSQEGVDAPSLKKFAEGFKFGEIDTYLKGGK